MIRVLPTLAWAHLELGDVATAREAAVQAIPWERAEDYRLFLPEALRVRAMVAAREGRAAEAEGTLEEGLALARHMRYPYAEARLLHVYGELNLQTGAVGPACKRLEAALAIFRRLGAWWDAAQVERTLAGLGAPGEPATAGPGADIDKAPAGSQRGDHALDHGRYA